MGLQLWALIRSAAYASLDIGKKYNMLKFHKRHYDIKLETANFVSFTKIKKFLKTKSIVFVDGYTSIQIKECNWCFPLKKKTSTKGNDLYINKKTGHFLCEACRQSGTWDILERLISDSKSSTERTLKELAVLKDGCLPFDKGSSNWKQIVDMHEPLHIYTEEEVNEIFSAFNLPRCSKSVYEKLKIYIDKNKEVLYFPLYVSEKFVVGYKTIKKENRECKTFPRSNCPGYILISSSSRKKHDSAVLVPTVQDLFALASENIQSNLICLPYGISNLPPNLLFFLEHYEKIILWFGHEIGSSDAARNFAKKLSDKRCYIVMPTERQYSASLALSKGQNIKKILSSAQPTWHQAITTFSSLRDDVLSELQNNDRVQGVKWVRYPVLNKILKGHRRGELTVLTGPTGSGKTTFMSEYSLDLAMQGVNTLWGSFEIRNARLARTMLQQLAGMPLDENLNEFDKWADTFEQLPIYFMMFHGQQSVQTVMDAVEHASYIHDITHVIIDNVQFMMGVTDDSRFVDRFWRQDTIIQSFRTFATKNNCHVTLVIHPRKEKEADNLTTNSIFGGAKAAQEADNILIIQDKRLTQIKGKKYLQISKNRYTGDLGIMPLEFDKPSLSYAVKKKKSVSSNVVDEENKLPDDKPLEV